MTNSENNVVFLDSILKTTAKQEMDLDKELAIENINNITIDELLNKQENNEEKK